jgi:tetratricopeptide (TPR) repeat protein
VRYTKLRLDIFLPEFFTFNFLNIMSALPKNLQALPVAQQQLTPEQGMTLATELQAKGQLREAGRLLRQVVAQQPNHALAHHLLGIVAHQLGNHEFAYQAIQQAIALRPNTAVFHANLIEICRQLGKLDEAVQQGETAIRLAPSLVMAHSNLGIVHFDRKDYAQAEACQRHALQLNPNFAPAFNGLGNIQRERKEFDAAKASYQQAIAADANYLEAQVNLGALLVQEGSQEEAKATLEQVLKRYPNHAEASCNMGRIHLAAQQNDEALLCYQHALAARPNYSDALKGLAKTHQALENLTAAETVALKVLKLEPNNAGLHALLGDVNDDLGKPQQAEAAYNRALELEPNHEEALLGLGELCMELGQMERAEALYQRALQTDRKNLAAHSHLIQVKKIKPDDASFLALQEVEKNLSKLPENRRMSLHFALGKCYDDLKDYQQAFPHFLAGCQTKRAQLEYDESRIEKQFADLIEIFSADAIQGLRGSGDASSVPIFVLGMPRSGTTLTEQIIASHPSVFGAGELPDLLRTVSRKNSSELDRFPNSLRHLTPALLTQWGGEYLNALRAHAPNSTHITDKMPANFFMVGLIHLMLPNAKIIHVNRNPVDTCLSCFTRLFKGKQEHTYDLAELGRYYVQYTKLMQHWRTVLPAGSFLDVQYEDIVADKEAAARRILAYCGLEWDAACLDFHETVRPIRTASVTQVRQPIYTSSVERWRPYQAFLTPLLDALGELVPNRGA